jgi:hypothetical protein
VGPRAGLDMVSKNSQPPPGIELRSPDRPARRQSLYLYSSSSSFLGSTAQLRPWPPPQDPAEFLGGFSTIFFFTG